MSKEEQLIREGIAILNEMGVKTGREEWKLSHIEKQREEMMERMTRDFKHRMGYIS